MKPAFHHLCSTLYSDEAADALERHLRPAGSVRMALLLHLARYPEGISQKSLLGVALAALPADARRPTDDDLRVMCGHMAARGLLAAEATASGARYFSPNARKAFRIRAMHGHMLPHGAAARMGAAP